MRKNFNSIISMWALGGALALPAVVQAANVHYDLAQDLFDMGRWADARMELLEARRDVGASDYSQLQKIDYLLFQCEAELRLDGADGVAADFLTQYPHAPYRNDIAFLRGLIWADGGDSDAALSNFDEVDPSRLSPEDQELYYIRKGYLLFEKGDYDEAAELLKHIGKDSDYYTQALYCLSYISYFNGDYKEAKAGFEDLLDDEVFASIVPYYLLQVEFLMGNYDGAINYGEPLLATAEGEKLMMVARSMAEAYYRMERYDDAVNLIDRYILVGGELGREEAYIKGFSLHQLGRYADAIEPLKGACGADDELTQNASFHLANCYIHAGDKRGARTAFSMAANDEFNEAIAEEALFNYAKLQYELGDGPFNESINLLTRYINKYDDPERLSVARTLLVAAYYNTRDYATAYQNIDLIRNPDSEILAAKQKIAYLNGLEQFNSGNYEDAEGYLNESIDVGITTKQIALATYWLGEIDFLEGDYDGAIERYNYLLARAPKGDTEAKEALYNIGYALMMKGGDDAALDYFERFVKSGSSNRLLVADAWSRIGDIYYGQRKFSDATKAYQSAADMGGAGCNYAQYQIAIINGIQGNSSAKIKGLKRITDPAQGEEHLDDAMYELGQTYIVVERYKDAVKTLKRFLELYPSSPLYAEALSKLGMAYINMGDSESSLEYYDRAIKSAPQSQIAKDAMQGIREIYVGGGDAEGYFDYAEENGMEGDLNAVARDSLSFASARGVYFASEGEKGKIQNAANALAGYVASYPKGYYLNDALFFLSDSYIKLGDNDRAISTLEQLGNRGASQYSESLYSKLSTMCYELGQYEKSASASRKLYDVAKSGDARHEAMSRYVDATLKVGDNSAVDKMTLDVIKLGEKSVGSKAFSRAQYTRATMLRKRGERVEALALYKLLAKSNSIYRSEAEYYVIDDSYRAGKRDEAKDMIFKFADKGGSDPYWLAKGFLLLGDIYVAEGDAFQARATYQSIVDGYSNQSDGVVEEAKRKIGDLK